MSVPTDNVHLPHWRVNSLSPSEEQQELELQDPYTDHAWASEISLGQHPGDHPPWEDKMVGKIQVMSEAKRSLVLETICLSLQDDDAYVGKKRMESKDVDPCIQELLTSVDPDLRNLLGQSILFHVFGLVLRESPGTLLQMYLPHLLELPHYGPVHREGMALAVGIASSTHLEEVWAVLEHLGQNRFLKSTSAPDNQLEPNLHWKWVSSTALLCYGQMATQAGEQILPWVDNLMSHMVYYFSFSNYDNVLKTSFLRAAIMLTRSLRGRGSQSYKFAQIPELIQCLLSILQKEPNFLASLLRQKIILIILGLRLQPYLKPMVKSRILKTCLQSLYPLPPMEMLEISLPLLDPVPDVMMLYDKTMKALNLLLQSFISENESMDEIYFLLQHTETWLQSRKSHERKRVVQSICLLLQYAVEKLNLTEQTTPSMLGHQIGLLTLLWRDKDEVTQYHSHHCVYLLLQLLTEQKGLDAESTYLNRLKSCGAHGHRDWERKLYCLMQALDRSLTVAQHTQLVLTFLHGLCSSDHLCSDLAAELLFITFEDPGIKPEQVAEILQGLFHELPAILFRDVQLATMKAVTILGTQHTQETVEVTLSLSPPTNRQVQTMWKALGANDRLARKVVTALYMKMKLRPPKELVRPNHQAELVSLLALGTVYELLYMAEYKPTVRWAFAGVLLALLTQLHYLFELGCVEGISDHVEDTLDLQPLSPSRTCLEALKGLFWTTNYWEVFAYVKLLGGWELLEQQDTYTEGVTLLARAMAHYNCEVRAVLGQAIIFLKSAEERDNVVAVLIITELLNSQELPQYMSPRSVDSFLSLGLHNPNPLVRAMSLKGLSSPLMHPEKVDLLLSRLAALLDSLLKPEPQDPLGLMQIVGYVLQCLGPRGGGALSLKVAQHLLLLFDDDREEVRGGAIFLFGDVIHSGGKKHEQSLKEVTFQALVPLLFHLADPCPKVVANAKLTFLRCAILLKWEFRKELFCKLAWGRGLSAQNQVFIYTVESNFGSYPQFLMQASQYLGSPYRSLKLVAMKFVGGLLHDYFTDLCFSLRKEDLKTLRTHLGTLRQEQDSLSRRFYRSMLEDITELSQCVA